MHLKNGTLLQIIFRSNAFDCLEEPSHHFFCQTAITTAHIQILDMVLLSAIRPYLVGEVKLLSPLSRFIRSIERRLITKNNYMNGTEIERQIHLA
jgi:hypothetical protein